jgi:hypothetical protein
MGRLEGNNLRRQQVFGIILIILLGLYILTFLILLAEKAGPRKPLTEIDVVSRRVFALCLLVAFAYLALAHFGVIA